MTHRSAIAPKIGLASNPTMGSIVYIRPTINDENPNWRISVGIKGTAGDVPNDKQTIIFSKKKFIHSLDYLITYQR